MHWVMLWTDYFVYLLFILGCLTVFKILQDDRLRAKWQKVIYRPLTIIAMLLLGCYIFIGGIDSIHFQKDGNITSLLDSLLSPLHQHTEKTYSRPFAVYSFNKENIEKLRYAGGPIQLKLMQVFLQTLILWLAFSILVLGYRAFKHKLAWEAYFGQVFKGSRDFPWRSFLLTLFFILFICLFINIFKSSYHILGTNEVGEDVLYQTLKSIRTGLIIGTLTTLVMLPFALFFGVIAGYFRGWVDDVVQYCYTTLSSIPGVLLIAAAVLSLEIVMDRHADWFRSIEFRIDARLLALCIILGISSWAGLCRLLRGETLKIREMDYVASARVQGLTHFSILIKHILPNIFHLVLITMVLDFSGLVLAEAVLSYVGVGVDPSSYSWGIMINNARMEMARIPVIWWSLVAAFMFMFVLVLSANIFSDAVREVFDPRS